MAGPSCPPSCDLYSKGSGFVPAQGSGSNGILLLGEAPGVVEAKTSQPFRGPAGLMLATMLHRLGMNRDDFLITNRSLCVPPRLWMEGAPWEQSAIEHCRPYFQQVLEQNPQIKVIMPLGNSAMHYLLQQKGISNFHGTAHWHSVLEKWIVPSFHPSYLMRGNWREIQTSRFDFGVAADIAAKCMSSPPELAHKRLPVDYLQEPSATSGWEWAYAYKAAWQADPELPLAADIENPYGSPDEEDAEDDVDMTIDRISFAYGSHIAMTMPWEGPYIEIAKWLLGQPGEKWWWNGDRHDGPRLRAANAPWINSVDIQELWHFMYPDLPKKLGYVAPFFTDGLPWKHLKGVEEPFYSCEDSARLWTIGTTLKKAIIEAGRWPSFQAEILDINKRTALMSANGIAIDDKLRLSMVTEQHEFKDKAHIEVQALVPLEFKPVHPKKGYKQPQPQFRCEEGHKLKDWCDRCRDTQGWAPDKLEGSGLRQIEVEDWLIVEGRQQIQTFIRWAQVEDFNLNSPKQLLEYLEWKHGSKAVPKHKKSGKDTIERDQLERLARKTGDPVLLLAVQASEVQSKISHLEGWAPGEDGLIHTQITNNPATFRFAAKKPNAMNFPNRSEDAQQLRQMVIPGSGYEYIVSRDYRGIEAIQVGIYAGDSEYERLARFGIHTFMAAKFAKLDVEVSWSDEDLMAALNVYKGVTQNMRMGSASDANLYDSMKRGNHMTNYGATSGMLQMSYPELFPKRKDAQAVQDFIFDLFPKIKQWQNAVVERAHKDARLVNDFGYVRWFWFVKKPVKRKGKWVWVRGEDAKAAIATLPQSSAAVIMRRAIGSSASQRLLNKGYLFLTIHDELLARARDQAHANWVNSRLKEAMEMAIPEQGNRVFKTTGKRGLNWGLMTS